MIHCDECVHIRWQQTLFIAPPVLTVKKGRRTFEIADPEAGLHLDTPHGYCNVGVSITFQMPGDSWTSDNWGFRPTHSCHHFKPKEVAA